MIIRGIFFPTIVRMTPIIWIRFVIIMIRHLPIELKIIMIRQPKILPNGAAVDKIGSQ